MHHILKITGLTERGDPTPLDVEIELFATRARASKLPQLVWYIYLFRAMRALASGRFAEAEQLASRFLEIGQQVDDQNAAHSFGAHQAIRFWETGRPDRAARLAQQLSVRFPSVPGWKAAHAFFLFDAGQKVDAATIFERLAADGFSQLPRNEIWTTTVAVLGQVCADIGDGRRATQLYELLRGGEGQSVALGFAVASLGAVDRYLGLLAKAAGDFNTAASHLSHAIEHDRWTGSVPWQLRAQYDLAALLIRRGVGGDQEEGHALAAEVADSAKNLGMKSLARKATALRSAPPGTNSR